MSVGAVVGRHRLIVCIGTGGVGKTTIAAAIAIGAARRGRRVVVLTIDPARQLARALGLDGLREGGERVSEDALRAAGIELRGAIDAGMLDQKAAWDRFIARHAPTAELRSTILDNAFYQQLSSSFSGSTEYMAIEEMCRLDESGDYDLIVLDTPPAGHALDFLEAPARIDRLLDREVSGWLTRPYEAVGRGAWRSAGAAARFVLRRLERASGRSTLRDISAFFVALDAMLADVAERTRVARSLLRSPDAAFVLVTGPQRLVLAQTRALAARMRELRAPLSAVVLNRAAPTLAANAVAGESVFAALARAGATSEAIAWARREWLDAVAETAAETTERRALEAELPPSAAFATVAELDRDAHSLRDLDALAAQLWA